MTHSSTLLIPGACFCHAPQGIIGTDGRHYALDLFRLFPPDRVYMDCEEYQLRHRLSVFRPELLEAFLQ